MSSFAAFSHLFRDNYLFECTCGKCQRQQANPDESDPDSDGDEDDDEEGEWETMEEEGAE